MQELTLKEKQNESLKILKYLHELCEKENITYYLAYGTLLGAVRHKGFIPWDDDIDIWVPFEQYETLMEILKKDKTYRLFNYLEGNEWGLMFSKLSKKDTYGINEITGSKTPGLSVDIFPMVSCKEKDVKKFAHYQKMAYRINSYELKTCSNGIKKFIYGIYYLFGKTNLYYRKKFNKLAAKTNGNTFYFDGIIEASTITNSNFEKVTLSFEGYDFVAPKNYDKILHFLFNNYMQLPPESDREGHKPIYY